MKLRRPSSVEFCVQLLLGLALVMFLYDYIAALGADACGAAASEQSRNCYPWGVEGPSSELARYRSKSAYLRSGVGIQLVLGIAVLLPFFMPRAVFGIGAMILVLVLGLSQSEWLGAFVR